MDKLLLRSLDHYSLWMETHFKGLKLRNFAMRALSLILFLVLVAIAGLHVYWGMGGLWPGSTEDELIKTVIGAPSFEKMPPPWMSYSVAALLTLAAVIGLSASGVVPVGWEWLSRLGSGGVSVVFLGRGVAGYWWAYVGTDQTEPFATLDLSLYSPLCLALGLGFLALAWRGRA